MGLFVQTKPRSAPVSERSVPIHSGADDVVLRRVFKQGWRALAAVLLDADPY